MIATQFFTLSLKRKDAEINPATVTWEFETSRDPFALKTRRSCDLPSFVPMASLSVSFSRRGLCVAAPRTGPGDQNSQKPRVGLLLVTGGGPSRSLRAQAVWWMEDFKVDSDKLKDEHRPFLLWF